MIDLAYRIWDWMYRAEMWAWRRPMTHPIAWKLLELDIWFARNILRVD